MIVVNVDYVSEKELQMLGLVEGIGSGNTLQVAKDKALEAMTAQGIKLKADAIVNTRFESVLASDSIQVLAYGTAVSYRICYELQQF